MHKENASKKILVNMSEIVKLTIETASLIEKYYTLGTNNIKNIVHIVQKAENWIRILVSEK